MTSIDDALPIARPARQDALALKSRNGDDDGGDAFRKAFADIGKPQDGNPKTTAQRGPKAEQEDRPLSPVEEPDLTHGPASEQSTDETRAARGKDSFEPRLSSTKGETVPTRLMKNPEALAFLSRVPSEKSASAGTVIPADAEVNGGPQDAVSEVPTRASESKTRKTNGLSSVMPGNQALGTKKTDAAGADSGMPLIEPSVEKPRVAGVPKPEGMSETVAMLVGTDPETNLPAPARKGLGLSSRHAAESADAGSEPLSGTAETPAAAQAPPSSEQSDLRTLMALLGPSPAPQPTPSEAKPANAIAEMTKELPKVGPTTSLPAPTTEADAAAPNDQPDQIFRLARQDSRTSTLYLRGGTDGGKTANTVETPSAKVENVTVLEARRYLGIAPTLGGAMPMSANAQSVAQSLAGALTGGSSSASSPDTPGGPSGLAGGATGKVVNTLKIQMHPIDLGLVTATLRMRGDDLQIDLRVRTGEAYRQLSDDQDAMIKALQAQGFQVDQVNVVYAPADSGAGNDAPGQQGNQPSSQPGREGQSGFAPGGGDRNGSSGQRGADERRILNDIVRETAPPAQPGLSDDLYL